MTVSFQTPQIKQYNPQAQLQTPQPVIQTPQVNQLTQTQNTCACTAYTKNPYLCAYTPISHLVVPQGQVVMPQIPIQNLSVQPIQQPPANQTINYNQITPQINGKSNIFTPVIETKSGQAIATATAVSKPLETQESQIVYQGPVKIINPQITPVEQLDNEIDKQYRDYFVNKIKINEELKDVINSTTSKESSFFSKAVKFLGTALAIYGIFKFRNKIPIIKNIFK